MAAAPAPTDSISVAAPAKLNLYLHVLGKRADGYHRLDSLVAFAAVHDTVHIAPADGLRLSIDGPFAEGLSAGPDNLVLRAAELLRAEAGISAGAALRLRKRLPPAAGIGGGSADAAAALSGLIRLWNVAIGDADLADLALALGADVPVCLNGKSVFMGGIGEVLRPAPRLPEIPIVLVNPGVAVPTPAVFRARGGDYSESAAFDTPLPDTPTLVALLAERRNDLAAAAIGLAPSIADALAALDGQPGCALARMSGSGATCFGLFANAADAANAAAEINADHPDWWVVQSQLGDAP